MKLRKHSALSRTIHLSGAGFQLTGQKSFSEIHICSFCVAWDLLQLFSQTIGPIKTDSTLQVFLFK